MRVQKLYIKLFQSIVEKSQRSKNPTILGWGWNFFFGHREKHNRYFSTFFLFYTCSWPVAKYNMLRHRLINRRVLTKQSFLRQFTQFRQLSSDAAFDKNTTEATDGTDTTHEKPAPKTSRGVKLPPRDQRFVILSARASSILPRQKPKRITQQKLEFKSDQLDAQLKRLLVFKSEVPQDVVLESIQQLKPSTPSVSEKRYDQLYNDILRAYTAPQLREFIRQYAKSNFAGSKLRKTDLVKYIITNHWNLQKSKEISESSDVIVENVIDLSRRDLFIIVSRNGQLPRYWTKSGAKIVILGEERKIIVRSTADTFQWINASMTKALNNVKTKEFDVSSLQSIVDLENLPLDKIQRLSDVYIERDGNKLVASSFGEHRIDQAERLILSSSGFNPRQVDSFLCDSSENNLKSGVYSSVIEDDALSWAYRDRQWSRWRFVKRKIQKHEQEESQSEINIADIFDTPTKKVYPKNVDEPTHPNFKLLESKSSTPEDINLDKQDSVSEAYAKAITSGVMSTYNSRNFDGNPSLTQSENSNVTVAATFGYILHETAAQRENNIQNSFLAPAKGKRSATTFMSNIPFVSEFSRTLPLHSSPVEEDDLTLENGMKPDANIRLGQNDEDTTSKYFMDGKSPAEAIEELLDEPGSTTSGQSGVISDEHSYYVQMKFLPSPFNPIDGTPLNPDAFENLPPIEMWLEVDEKERADKNSVNIVAVDREATTYTSIPHMNADIKFSAAQTRFLDTNQHSVREFLAKSTLDFSGKVRINTPNILNLSLEEESTPVPYMYQTMLYRKQVDLDYNGQILQLASIEGGLVGGHRVEANLVLDTPASEFTAGDVDKLVRGAMSFLNDIQAPLNMALPGK